MLAVALADSPHGVGRVGIFPTANAQHDCVDARLEGGNTRGCVSDDRIAAGSSELTDVEPLSRRLLADALSDLRVQQAVIELQNEELRRAAERQQLLTRSYAALFELAPVATLEVTGTGGVARCNARAQELMRGVEPGASLSDLPFEPVEYDKLLQLVAFAEKLGRSSGTFESGGRCYRVDAAVISNAAERRTLLSFVDTTDQVAARRAAEHSAAQLRAILGASKDGVVVLSEREDVLFANEAWLSLTSARSPVLGSVLEEVVDGQSLGQRLLTAAKSESARAVDVRLGEGTANEVLAELTAVTVEYGGEPCALVTARDLTARRRLEAQAARNERLTSLGMLVAGVAHEINNPLTYVLGNLESLGGWAELSGSSDAPQILRDAMDGCQRIAAIIRELRSFYRSDEHQIVGVDLNQVARDAARFVAPKCRLVANVELELGEVPPIAGVQNSLVQVLINLIVNAIDAMPTRDASENVVRVRTGCRGSDVRVEVADNGNGIPSAELTRIFEPFFSRGKPNGSGLGLTISRNLIEQMNGWIDVDSRVGVGTRFIIHFEAASGVLAPAEPEVLPVSTELLAEARILVVDDEPLVARSVGRLLARAAEVLCVSSVAAALQLLAERPDIDVVISDWVMPDGGAPALLAELEARGRGDLPVVVMTGLGQLGRFERGDRPCIAKPVSRGVVLQAVAQALRSAPRRDNAEFGDWPKSAQFPKARSGNEPGAASGSG